MYIRGHLFSSCHKSFIFSISFALSACWDERYSTQARTVLASEGIDSSRGLPVSFAAAPTPRLYCNLSNRLVVDLAPSKPFVDLAPSLASSRLVGCSSSFVAYNLYFLSTLTVADLPLACSNS